MVSNNPTSPPEVVSGQPASALQLALPNAPGFGLSNLFNLAGGASTPLEKTEEAELTAESKGLEGVYEEP